MRSKTRPASELLSKDCLPTSSSASVSLEKDINLYIQRWRDGYKQNKIAGSHLRPHKSTSITLKTFFLTLSVSAEDNITPIKYKLKGKISSVGLFSINFLGCYCLIKPKKCPFWSNSIRTLFCFMLNSKMKNMSFVQLTPKTF